MITAVLLNWARPKNLPQILSALSASSLITEILVVDNTGTLQHNCMFCWADYSKSVLVSSSKDLGLFSRFAVAQLARNPYIWSQDDDWLIEPDVISEIYAPFRCAPDSVHGIFGRNPKVGPAPLREPVYAREYNYHNKRCEVILTSACMYSRSLIPYVMQLRDQAWYQAHCKWVEAIGGKPNNGEDLMLSYAAMNQSHSLNFCWKHRIKQLSSEGAFSASPTHYTVRTELMNLLRTHYLIGQ